MEQPSATQDYHGLGSRQGAPGASASWLGQTLNLRAAFPPRQVEPPPKSQIASMQSVDSEKHENV